MLSTHSDADRTVCQDIRENYVSTKFAGVART